MENTFLSNLPDLVKWVESNPLIVTLTSGGAIVWLFANLKGIFSSIVHTIEACISFTIANTYEDARGIGYNGLKLKQIAFNNILSSSKALWERTLDLDLNNNVDVSKFGNDCNATRAAEQNSLDMTFKQINASAQTINTYGFSIRLVFRKLCIVHRSYKLDGQRITMNTTVQVFFASKKKFMQKLEDAINAKVNDILSANGTNDYVSVYSDMTCGWKMKRSLSSIFTKDNGHIELFNSVKDFISNRDVYKKLNYPYNYCGLLYGVPGSGKTSTILAIASELKRNIYYMNMSQASTSQILKALNDNTEDTIYVFEDIDAISYRGASSREDENGNEKDDIVSKVSGMSLSDLLNITDGLIASDGAICLFTTNHIERLDPAFLRAGRMNKTVEFTYMTADVASDMVKAYLGEHISNMEDGIKPAELQECILDVLLGKKTIDDIKEKFCKKST